MLALEYGLDMDYGFFLVLGFIAFLLLVMLPIGIQKDITKRKKQKEELENPPTDKIEIYEKARVSGKNTGIQQEGSVRYFPRHSILYWIELETKAGKRLKFKVPQEIFEALKEEDIGTATVKNGELYAFVLEENHL